MAKPKVLEADVVEFGEDQGKPTVPQLIVALPESEREAYRERLRAHVREMTGSPTMTWARWMNGEKVMTDHEAEASAVATQARREIRDAFQVRNPHYTPPPWADRETWERWVEANIKMRGVRGFYDRGLHLQIHESFSALAPALSED